MKIIVLNLARTTTQHQLQALFTAHGKVHSCTIVMDAHKGTSKGFGFVEMPDDAQAQAAITALHGSKVDGNKIRVKLSTQGA